MSQKVAFEQRRVVGGGVEASHFSDAEMEVRTEGFGQRLPLPGGKDAEFLGHSSLGLLSANDHK